MAVPAPRGGAGTSELTCSSGPQHHEGTSGTLRSSWERWGAHAVPCTSGAAFTFTVGRLGEAAGRVGWKSGFQRGPPTLGFLFLLVLLLILFTIFFILQGTQWIFINVSLLIIKPFALLKNYTVD